jgi:hypothetical protein
MIRPPLRPGIDSRRPIRKAAVGNSCSVRGSSGGICRGWRWAPGRRVHFFRYTSDLRISPSRYLVLPGVRGLRTRPPPLLSRYRGVNHHLQFDHYSALTCSQHHLFSSEHVPRPRVTETLGVTPIETARQRVASTLGHPVCSGPLTAPFTQTPATP